MVNKKSGNKKICDACGKEYEFALRVKYEKDYTGKTYKTCLHDAASIGATDMVARTQAKLMPGERAVRGPGGTIHILEDKSVTSKFGKKREQIIQATKHKKIYSERWKTTKN